MPADPFMPDKSEAVLKDILNELKQGNAQAVGYSGAAARPAPAFIQQQQTMDRVVAGQWATLGWANAYQQPIKSSLANDLMGAIGLRAAPQSMWQREYEVMSQSMLVDRVASFPIDLLTPGFGRRSREMGAQIYQMSSRFNRAGDDRVTDIAATMRLGRELQLGAATDMRLSGQDYGTIMTESAKAGQFDFAGGLGDVKSQFNELRNAVADLTKTMRLGAGEVAQTMGAFRQFGIVDVADQRRMAERLASSSRVAGISTPEMAEMVRAGMTSGQAFGLGAEGSAALAQNLAMAARTATRAGLVSGNVLSAAGGVQGLVQSQQQAINAFAGSTAGFYTALGAGAGSTGGALDDLLAGIGATGGTLGGIMSAEARRMDFMGNMSGAQRQRLFNRNISQQIQMLGVDPNSAEATDYAFNLVRGQMGDAAGLAYARQNFSAEGRRQRWQNAYRDQMQLELQGAQRNYQMYMENEQFTGQFRQASGQAGRVLGEAGMGLSRALDWSTRWSALGTSSFQRAANQLGLEGDDQLNAESAIAAYVDAGRAANKGASRENSIKLMGSVSTGGGLAHIGGMAGGALAGGHYGAIAGTFLGGPVLGTTIGLIGGTILGGMAGAAGMDAITGAVSGATKVSGVEADEYLKAYAGSTGNISQRALNIAQGKESGALNSLWNSAAFHKIRGMGANLGQLSDKSSLDLSREITAAAKESGLDTETVAGVVRALGTDYKMQASYNSAAAGAQRYETKMNDVMEGVESAGLSIASAEVAEGIKAFASAKSGADKLAAQGRLAAAGISGRGMHNLIKQLEGLDEAARKQLAEDAGSYVTRRGNAVVNRRAGAFNRFAENVASEAGAMNQAGGREAYERIQELKKDPQALMEVMLGGGDTKDAALRDFLVRQDDTGTMGKLQQLGSIEDLMSTSNDERFRTITGLSSDVLSKMRTKLGEQQDLSPAQRTAMLRQAAAAMMIGQSAEVRQASDPTNVAANNMLLAANILREIQGKLAGTTATKESK